MLLVHSHCLLLKKLREQPKTAESEEAKKLRKITEEPPVLMRGIEGQKDDDAREEEEYRWDKMEVKGKRREV